jgi:hypothetical protein
VCDPLAEVLRVNCPECGTFEARIYRTMLGTHINRREQRCRCGISWQLIERMDKGSIRHWATPGEIQGEMPLGARNGHAVKRAAQSSGDISSLSDLDSDSDPNPNASESPERARVRRGRPSTAEYNADFLAFWDAITIHRGNKQPAFKAWVKIGSERPSTNFIISRYNRWAETEQWKDGFAPYVATWINAKGWETEPEAHEFKQRGAAQRKLESPAVRQEREREERLLSDAEERLFGVGR